MEARLLVNQTLSFDEILIEEKPSNREIIPELEVEIPERWATIEAAARAAGKRVWDGTTYRLNAFAVRGGQLHLEVAELPYSVRESLNEATRAGEIVREAACSRGLFATALTRTADNQFLFGALSGITRSTRRVSSIGGICTKDEQPLSCGADLERHMLTELREEAGVPETLVSSCVIVGLVGTAVGNVGYTTWIELACTFEEAEALFREQSDDEMKGLIAVPAADLSDYLRSLGGYDACFVGIAERVQGYH